MNLNKNNGWSILSDEKKGCRISSFMLLTKQSSKMILAVD